MKSIPKVEKVAVELEYKSGNYVITRNQTTEMFTIYEINNGEYTRLGKGRNPLDLEEKFVGKG